jgi:O-acetylhomoserine (thiol)-lyase
MENRTSRLTILIDPRKKQIFEEICASQDLTPSQVVRKLIRQYIIDHAGDRELPVETLAVHAGYSPDPTTKAVAVPIYQTTVLRLRQHPARRRPVRPQGGRQHLHPHHEPDAGRAGKARRRDGRRHRRPGAGLGQAAITYAIQTIAEAGDNIVSSSTLYGGTYNLFAHTLPQYGIEVRFADYRDPASFES